MSTSVIIAVSVVVAIVLAAIAIYFLLSWMKKRKVDVTGGGLEDNQPRKEIKNIVKDPIVRGPPTLLHHELKKDKTLQEEAKKLAQDEVQLKSEYSRLEEFVKENIIKETTVAKLEENKAHNRYLDIGLYLQGV